MVTVPKRELTAPEMQKMAMDLFNPEGKSPEIESLPKIEIVHAAQIFKMPGGSTTQVFRGAIIETYKCNAYWPEGLEESGGNQPPVCSSIDGISPDPLSEDIQAPGKVSQNGCLTCNWNKYGTDLKGGKGKACKNMRRLFILVDGYNLPLQLTCAPTSLKAFADISKDLYALGWPYQAGNMIFSLEKVATYSALKLDIADIEQDMTVLNNRVKMAKKFMSVMRGQEITLGEYMTGGGE